MVGAQGWISCLPPASSPTPITPLLRRNCSPSHLVISPLPHFCASPRHPLKDTAHSAARCGPPPPSLEHQLPTCPPT